MGDAMSENDAMEREMDETPEPIGCDDTIPVYICAENGKVNSVRITDGFGTTSTFMPEEDKMKIPPRPGTKPKPTYAESLVSLLKGKLDLPPHATPEVLHYAAIAKIDELNNKLKDRKADL